VLVFNWYIGVVQLLVTYKVLVLNWYIGVVQLLVTYNEDLVSSSEGCCRRLRPVICAGEQKRANFIYLFLDERGMREMDGYNKR